MTLAPPRNATSRRLPTAVAAAMLAGCSAGGAAGPVPEPLMRLSLDERTADLVASMCPGIGFDEAAAEKAEDELVRQLLEQGYGEEQFAGFGARLHNVSVMEALAAGLRANGVAAQVIDGREARRTGQLPAEGGLLIFPSDVPEGAYLVNRDELCSFGSRARAGNSRIGSFLT
ncbi:hypothetical protein [Mangrovicoccus sp. HB161399]|uniref:hypothetical protein n=1 Tax=Mangrovicoccus sp. HB161399 TaxID=2720392 RepID=UPI0015516632|nr:hypothetical protein [Mangrovicoccus sp. HB161399]